MYETDYETRASTYRTDYETQAIMYETDYETRASTYRTGYETRAIMYETDYETRASTYRTGYEARASTYRTDYETRAIMYETGYETQATTYRTDLADAADTCAYLQTQHAAVVASVGCSCLIGPQVTRLTALRRLGDPQVGEWRLPRKQSLNKNVDSEVRIEFPSHRPACFTRMDYTPGFEF
ncbi:hypothetical protein MJT46_012142 [Ovis ammon polii x Ovis aries]|nr:hypothetical protein MJT46_012142 [Ovis ammon polii x Ovis aries]